MTEEEPTQDEVNAIGFARIVERAIATSGVKPTDSVLDLARELYNRLGLSAVACQSCTYMDGEYPSLEFLYTSPSGCKVSIDMDDENPGTVLCLKKQERKYWEFTTNVSSADEICAVIAKNA